LIFVVVAQTKTKIKRKEQLVCRDDEQEQTKYLIERAG
jgi:hypothetical protein